VRAERGVDPRIERSRQVILRAALSELGEAGYGAFTIESVAARAAVAKSTIYRHWSDKISLIADAFEAAHEHAAPSVEGLTSREGLQCLLGHIARGVAEGEFRAAVDPELAAQALLGPIFYQRLMTSEPLDPSRVGDLIDLVLGP
jgi:TetR/AcrR family transcriptional regulator of autoinduction and epiphytic fitness